MLLDMNLQRIIQVFVVQLGLGIFYLVLGIKILKKDKKRLNLLIFSFYALIFLSMLMNVIYVNIADDDVVRVLHYLTIILSFISYAFLFTFNLILAKSEKVFDTKKQVMTIVLFVILNGLLFLAVPNGITIGSETDGGYPKYSNTFFIPAVVVMSCCVFPMFYYAIFVSKKFKDPELKKKWRSYILGLTTQTIAGYGILISNRLFNDTFRTTWTFVSLVCIIATCILIYKGLARQLSKK